MKRKEEALTPLAQRLRALRAASGMTQQELADHLGLTRSAYAYYETGATRPPLKTLQRIAAEYLVTVEYLLGEESSIAGSLPLRQDSAFEGAERMRECDKQERAFLSMLRRLGDEGKEKLYFYCLDLLEGEGALADLMQEEST
ncbi:MAG: helix-turn-helix transcriptional regulator [Clostridia bacterium]|nr:helix-turn-helix transcriptional regulator [Clostridia bacterium]